MLIDCGVSKQYLNKQLATIGYHFDDIQYLLLTHDHSDHNKYIHHFKDKTIIAHEKSFEQADVKIEDFAVINLEGVQIKFIPLSHDASSIHGVIFQTSQYKLVYVTDTGYVPKNLYPYLEGANFYVLESNHDPQLLMASQRPYFLKQRILSDRGHLSNEDSALLGTHIISEQTKQIVLAHLSEEANSPEHALKTWEEVFATKGKQTKDIEIKVAKQHEVVKGGSHEV